MDARRPIKPIISDPLIIPRVKQVKFAESVANKPKEFACVEISSFWLLLLLLCVRFCAVCGCVFVRVCMCVFFLASSSFSSSFDTSAVRLHLG